MDFNFLQSTRFWKLVLAGLAAALFQEGVITQTIFALLETILIGSVTIRTVDRFAEKIGSK